MEYKVYDDEPYDVIAYTKDDAIGYIQSAFIITEGTGERPEHGLSNLKDDKRYIQYFIKDKTNSKFII